MGLAFTKLVLFCARTNEYEMAEQFNDNAKMSSLVGALLSLIILVSAFAVTKMEKVALEIDSIANNNIPLTKVVTDLTVHQLESAVMLEKLLRFSQIPLESSANEQLQYLNKLRLGVDKEARTRESQPGAKHRFTTKRHARSSTLFTKLRARFSSVAARTSKF